MSEHHDLLAGSTPASTPPQPNPKLLLENPKRIRSENEVNLVLSSLPALSIDDLRIAFRRVHGATAPPVFGRDLLTRAIAYRIQEQVFGGLSRETKKLLHRLANKSGASGRDAAVPRRIKPGSVIVRAWRGTSHQVTVLPDGFEWNGAKYASLSEIARLITGTRWNGPRYFGLRTPSTCSGRQDGPTAGSDAEDRRADDHRKTSAPPRRRGRPRKSLPAAFIPASRENDHAL